MDDANDRRFHRPELVPVFLVDNHDEVDIAIPHRGLGVRRRIDDDDTALVHQT